MNRREMFKRLGVAAAAVAVPSVATAKPAEPLSEVYIDGQKVGDCGCHPRVVRVNLDGLKIARAVVKHLPAIIRTQGI